ncbi:hypothetical protein BCR44DRAFT_1231238 [Catenaria anguillulae PL171]|uniref:Uncharacterized protein n=1 Tax=Catenaria anguillulae PL171 TaxID=765915 RepID=A0A1Y2HDM3_9FUNG|nr:hypothetical protein BCR44DRAFT_1231238 [Catenaria anguillulae PL171]
MRMVLRLEMKIRTPKAGGLPWPIESCSAPALSDPAADTRSLTLRHGSARTRFPSSGGPCRAVGHVPGLLKDIEVSTLPTCINFLSNPGPTTDEAVHPFILLLALIAVSANAQSRILTPSQCAEKLNLQRCLGLTQADLAVPRTQAESLAFIKTNICSPQCTAMWDQYTTLGTKFLEQQCGGAGASVPAEWQRPHMHRAAHMIMCTQDAQGTLCSSSLSQAAVKLNVTRPIDHGTLQPYPLAALPKDVVCSECTTKLMVVARELDEQLNAKGEAGVGIPVPFDDKAVVEKRTICREMDGAKKDNVGPAGSSATHYGAGRTAFGIVLLSLAVVSETML